ncbi:MAG: GNAT family N-acetyltransferase [Pseudomonadota bacterium]|nr:GNAT family N-acetyltransferase [Pseudomonadota bacterium]
MWSSSESSMIRLATTADTPALAQMLARSFAQEEFWTWMIGTHAGAAQRLEQGFATQIRRFALPHRHVWCGLQHEAAALWSPPNGWHLGLLQQVQLLPEFVQLVGVRRLWAVSRVIDAIQAVHPRTPHYYLQVLGADPAQQGKGWSHPLMHVVLDQADQQQMPCYLETATPSNLSLYRRFGFEIIHTLDNLPYDAPTM